jgi:DNA-binding HxlR family transcriptional regulator
MRTMRPVHDASCSVACTADIIGPRTLSERLRVLEQEEIIQRTSARRRVDYSLTGKGKALLPIIDAMRQFGHEWLVPEHGHAHPSADETALV